MKNLKTYVIPVLIFFAISNLVLSQSLKGYGFKAGLTFSKYRFEGIAPNGSVKSSIAQGFNAGLFLDIYKNGKFFVSSELVYDQSRSDIEVNYKDNSGNVRFLATYKYKIEYLNYSLNFRYEYGKSSIVPYLFAGPKLNFYLADGPGIEDDVNGRDQLKIHDNLKKFILSASIGIGIEIKVEKKMSFLVESNYSPGIFNTYDDDVISAKNDIFEFKAGCRIFYQ